MRVAKVVGSLSLSRTHPSLIGKRWLLAAPQSLSALTGAETPAPEELVVIDELGARAGDLIGIAEGGEAAFPFIPERKPVDAYAACILDELDIDEEEAAKQLKRNEG